MGRLSVRRLLLWTVAVLTLWGTPVLGVDQEDVEQWVRSVVERSEEFPPVPGYSIGWREEIVETISAAELAAMRREASGKPDHPLWQSIEMYSRRLQNGPDITRIRLYARDAKHWRCNFTLEYLDKYWDRTVTPKTTWALTDKQLAIIDPSYQIPNGRDFARSLPSLRGQLGQFLYGGLNSLPWMESWSVHRASDPGAWLVRSTHTSGSVHEYVLRWHDELSQFIVASRTEVAAPPGREDRVGSRVEYSGWRHDDVLGSAICTEVRRLSKSNTPTTLYFLEGFEPLAPDALEAMLRVPDVQQEDSLRGMPTATTVYDYRPEEQKVARLTPDGAHEEPLVVPRQHSKSWWRTAGWILLTALVVLFVALWLRNR